MRYEEACAVLGLALRFEPDELRTAYHAAARRLHPDRPDAPTDATEQMVIVNLAYALLSDPSGAAHVDDRTADRAAASRTPGRTMTMLFDVELFDDGSLLIDAPAEETFEQLLEAIEVIGDPTYVDADAGLLQIIVAPDGSGHCYLTFSLQGRANGTEIFTTIEPLDHQDPPDPWPLLDRLADRLRGA